MNVEMAVSSFIAALTSERDGYTPIAREQVKTDPSVLISKSLTTDTYVVLWQGASYDHLHTTSDDPAKSVVDPQGVTHRIGITYIISQDAARDLPHIDLYGRLEQAVATVKNTVDFLNDNRSLNTPIFYRTDSVDELEIERSEDTTPQARTLITITATENTR